jgi:hypothetical protein
LCKRGAVTFAIEIASHAFILPMTGTITMTRTLPIVLITTILFAWIGSAAANERDDAFHEQRTKFGFGMLVGSYDVGPISGPAIGYHAEVGRRFGTLALFGEYNMLSMGESSTTEEEPVRGILHRGALNVRYTFAEVGGGRKVPVQGAFWVEGGLGRHVVYWHEGGKLSRNDVGLGVGGQVNFRVGREKPQVFGFYYAFRTTIAQSPTADETAPATCGGPCDEATPPSSNDLGLHFNMGLEWGR